MKWEAAGDRTQVEETWSPADHDGQCGPRCRDAGLVPRALLSTVDEIIVGADSALEDTVEVVLEASELPSAEVTEPA
ncbi:hypothetical protein [Nonomuraea sp. NPDC003804]|uniref:hypothetical protein n=1 Tax=Nonomuraea sp. NPDC003804 TaxID=3154547 RepID=UPI0033AEF66F